MGPGKILIPLSLTYCLLQNTLTSPLTSVMEDWASGQQFLSLLLFIFISDLCVVIRMTLTVYSHVAMLPRGVFTRELGQSQPLIQCCFKA